MNANINGNRNGDGHRGSMLGGKTQFTFADDAWKCVVKFQNNKNTNKNLQQKRSD